MFLPSNITLKFGDSGDFVSELQRRLSTIEYFPKEGINGFYDGATVTAVTSFQNNNGIKADGVAGPETLRRLNGIVSGDATGEPADKKEEEEKKKSGSGLMNRLAAAGAVLPQEAPAAVFGAKPAQAPQNEPVQPQQAQPEAPPPTLPPLPQPTAAPAQYPMPSEATRDAVLAQQQNRLDPTNNLLAADSAVQQQQQPAKPLLEETAPAAQAAAAEPPRRNIIQRIVDYIESKLSPPVLREVQQVGQTMANAGVREAPIPTGPEMAPAAPALSAGQQQQAGQER